MSRHQSLIWLYPTLLYLACGEGPSGGTARLARDSAGVRIIDVSLPQWRPGEEWLLNPDPTVVIGGGDSERDQLFRVGGAVRLGDGTLVIANLGSSELRYHDSSGQWFRNGGRPGEGPGEFGIGTGPWSLGKLPADTVVAWDFGNLRLSLFDRRGDFVSSATLRPKQGTALRFAGVLSDGGIVVYTDPLIEAAIRGGHPVGKVFRDTLKYQLYSSDGVWSRDIAALPGAERWTFEWSGQIQQTQRPFGRAPSTTVGNGSFYYTSGDGYDILRFNVGGRLEAIMRIRSETRNLGRQDISDFIQDRMAAAPDTPADRHAWRSLLDNAPFPEQLPAFDGLKVDQLGNLWARLYSTPSDSAATWMVLGPDEGLLGRVAMPLALRPYEIGVDYVLGAWRDTADVEYVRMYRIMK